MHIRTANQGDAEAICALHRASIRRLCSGPYSPEQIADWVDSLEPARYPPQMRQFEFVVGVEEQIVGFCVLDVAGRELHSLYVHPDAAGRGVGRRLLEHAIDHARGRSVSTLRLNSTWNAVPFYQASGFTRVRECVHSNPAGFELTCVEMVKDL